jgi:hypothetical protein
MDQNNNESKLEFNFNYPTSYKECPPTPRLSDFDYYSMNNLHMNSNENDENPSPRTPISKFEFKDTTTPKLDEKVRKSILSLELIMESMNKSILSKQLDEIVQETNSIITVKNELEPSQAYKEMNRPVFKQTFEKEIAWTSLD